jgi:glycosyltransferase involved in cell wall biosynthesis
MDLLVLPSTNEGMSNATLEAMATGVPVLAHVGCGHEAIICDGRDGWIRDLATEASLFVALCEIMNHRSQLVAAGKAARETVSRQFSLGTMLSAYRDLYHSMR